MTRGRAVQADVCSILVLHFWYKPYTDTKNSSFEHLKMVTWWLLLCHLRYRIGCACYGVGLKFKIGHYYLSKRGGDTLRLRCSRASTTIKALSQFWGPLIDLVEEVGHFLQLRWDGRMHDVVHRRTSAGNSNINNEPNSHADTFRKNAIIITTTTIATLCHSKGQKSSCTIWGNGKLDWTAKCDHQLNAPNAISVKMEGMRQC